MRKSLLEKLTPEDQEIVREANREYANEYYRKNRDKVSERTKESRRKNPLGYAKSMAKYWNKKVAELEAQQKEDTPNV